MNELTKIVKEIKARKKKAGEVLDDKEYNNLKNLAKLCVRLYLEFGAVQDLMKQNWLLGEHRYDDLKSNP